jgi:hypothetical protein
MAAVVTLGTGMSCISSVCRSEDNGSNNEDNLDDRQQRPNSSSPKCAMREKRNPDRPTSTFSKGVETKPSIFAHRGIIEPWINRFSGAAMKRCAWLNSPAPANGI